MSWRTFSKLSVFGLSSLAGATLYYSYRNKISENLVAHSSWTTNYVSSVEWDTNWDHRSLKSLVKPIQQDASVEKENAYNAKLEAKKPTATRHIIMIRHGQYNLNGKTDTDRFLTEVGSTQAKFSGERLAELKIPFDNVVISTMTRAQQTGKIILSCLPKLENLSIENDSMLEEGAPIPPEPKVGHWRPEQSQFFQDGARIEAAFRSHFHRADASQLNDSYTLLVCHANVIRYFVCRALQFPPEAWLRISLHHASITWLTIHANGRVILRTLGDSGHIPLKYLTSK